jgi:hypothetical protein
MFTFIMDEQYLHSNKNSMLLGVYFNWQYHNIPKGIILDVNFQTTNQ